MDETGFIAGKVWHYLDNAGTCKVNKLSKAIEVTDRQLQRALGWLERENKIQYSVIGRSEAVGIIH